MPQGSRVGRRAAARRHQSWENSVRNECVSLADAHRRRNSPVGLGSVQSSHKRELHAASFAQVGSAGGAVTDTAGGRRQYRQCYASKTHPGTARTSPRIEFLKMQNRTDNVGKIPTMGVQAQTDVIVKPLVLDAGAV